MPDREGLLLAKMQGITARRELKQQQDFMLIFVLTVFPN